MPISEVFNEDNLIGMARYPDKFFDLAIVDPPYGISMEEGNSIWIKKKFSNKGKSWDSEKPNEKYFSELYRVSKNQIIWGGGIILLNTCPLLWVGYVGLKQWNALGGVLVNLN